MRSPRGAAAPVRWCGSGCGSASRARCGWRCRPRLFALFVATPITGPESFLRYATSTQGDFLFLLWLVLGGLGAALVFAATAVSPPLLLGRVIDLRSALLTSIRAVGENPLAMALWALVIMVATALSMATLMAGFVVAIPVLGHATWHAYRDLVDASSLPLRH